MRLLPIAFGVAILLHCAPIHLAAQLLQPSRALASSEMKDPKYNYGPSMATDATLQTWWTPAPPNSNGSNQWLRLEYDKPVRMGAIRIHGGSHYPNYPGLGNIYGMNHRLRQAKLVFSDGSSEEIVLADVDSVQTIRFAPRESSSLELRPKSVYNGSKWADLCISALQVLGSQGGSNTTATDRLAQLRGMIGIWRKPQDSCYAHTVVVYQSGTALRVVNNYVMDQQEITVRDMVVEGKKKYFVGQLSGNDGDERIALPEGYVRISDNKENALLQNANDEQAALQVAWAANTRYFLNKLVAGDYVNDKGEAVLITDKLIITNGKAEKYTYDADPYSEGCGLVSIGEQTFTLRFGPRQLRLHLATRGEENNTPGYAHISEKPTRTYTRK